MSRGLNVKAVKIRDQPYKHYGGNGLRSRVGTATAAERFEVIRTTVGDQRRSILGEAGAPLRYRPYPLKLTRTHVHDLDRSRCARPSERERPTLFSSVLTVAF